MEMHTMTKNTSCFLFSFALLRNILR